LKKRKSTLSTTHVPIEKINSISPSLSFFQVAASASSEIVLPNKYCESIFKTVRRPTRTINVSESDSGGRDCRKREEASNQGADESRAEEAKQASGSGAPLLLSL